MSILSHTSGIERAEIFYEIARERMDTNNELSYKYATEGYEVSKSTRDTITLIRAPDSRLNCSEDWVKLILLLVLLDEVLPIAKRHDFSSEVRTILNSLGVAYLRLAKYDKALLFFLNCQKDVNEDRFWRRTVLNNIGLVYENLEDFDTALKYYIRLQ